MVSFKTDSSIFQYKNIEKGGCTCRVQIPRKRKRNNRINMELVNFHTLYITE